MSVEYDPFAAECANHSAQVIQIESSKLLPVLILVAVLGGSSIAAAAIAWHQAAKAETETRMLEYYILELDGKLMQSGTINFKDSYSARKQAPQPPAVPATTQEKRP